ncbi:MAG: LamG domain-containing protein [Nanoarchaeota archaeon]|nr:LamG domain-containing protein [Nanoarchaeota archaeon]
MRYLKYRILPIKDFENKHLKFNGRKCYVYEGDLNFLHQGAFNISFDIKTRVPRGERHCLFDTSGALSRNVGINIQIDNGLNGEFNNCLWCYITRGENIKPVIDIIANNKFPNDNKWHNILITYDNKVGKIYIDNELKMSSTTTGFKPSKENSHNPLHIGCAGDESKFFTGELKNMKINEE